MLRLLTPLFICFIFSISAQAQLSGTYVVNPNGGGDYSSLTAAAAAINSQGMSGNVTIQLATALYEEQVLFDIPGQTANQLLTLESQSGNEEDVVFRFEETLEEADYQLAFNEIQALEIRNISINTSSLEYGTGIKLTGECSNILVDNLHHEGNRNNGGIVGAIFDFITEVDPVQNVTVINSYFYEASPSIGFGVGLFQEPILGLNSNFTFTGNTFQDADGISVNFISNVLVENNIFHGIEYKVKAIEILNGEGSIQVSANNIWKSSFNSVNISNCTGTAENQVLVTNNFISGDGVLTQLSTNNHLLYAYNSVYSDDDGSSQNLISTFGNENTRILNNIFYQNHEDGSLFSLFNESLSLYDHNCLYSNGTYAFGFDDLGLVYFDYEEYKDETGRETNGISTLPIFAIPGEDLHASNQALNVALPLSEVTTDIDGETRSPSSPSIGADEIDGILVVEDLTIDTVLTSGDLNAGEQLTISWSGANNGNSLFSAPWTDRIFLSDDTVLDNQDLEIGSFQVTTDLPPFQEYSNQKIVSLALNLSGLKYVIVQVDSEADLIEDAGNNTAVSTPINIAAAPLPNLVVTNITLPDNVFSGTQLQVQFTVTNEGTAPASGNWTEVIWYENEIDGFDAGQGLYHLTNTPFASEDNIVGLMPGESYVGTAIAETPYISQGYSYIRVETDRYDNVVEEVANNNNFTDALIESVFVNQSPLADLIIEDIQSPSESFAGEEISITYTIKNNGTQTTSPVELPYDFYFGWTWAPFLVSDWLDYTYVSDALFDFEPDQYHTVYPRAGNLEVDDTYLVTETIQLPRCTSGPYFVTVYTDRWNHVAELVETNNAAISDTIHIISRPEPDLIPSSEDPMTGLVSNSVYTLSYSVSNLGADTAFANWNDRIFLSDSSTFQFDIDEMIADTLRIQNMLADENANFQFTFPIAPEHYGQKYLYLWIDAENDVCEHPYDNNNILQIPVNIAQSPAADLQIAYFPPTGPITAGDDLNLSAQSTNIGSVSTTNGFWTDMIKLTFEESDEDSEYIETYLRSGNLNPNGAYSLPNPFTVPLDIQPGFYRLSVINDSDAEVWENEQEENNIVQSEPFQIVIDSSRTPDLKPINLENQVWNSGETYDVEVTVSNLGVPTGIGTWVDELQVTDAFGETLSSAFSIFSGNVDTDGSYTALFQIEIPSGTPSEATFVARIDTSVAIFEYNQANNTVVFPITVNANPAPDLSPTLIDITESVNAGQELRIDVTRSNLSTASVAGGNWVDRILLSTDNLPSDNDINLRSYTFVGENLTAESTTLFTDSVQIPLTYTGTYYVIYVMDLANQVAEGQMEGNNFIVSDSPLNITTPAPVDFNTSLIDIDIVNDNPEQLNYTLTNSSTNTFTGKFYNTWYLSADDTYSTDDKVLGMDQVADYTVFGGQIQLSPGASSNEYTNFIYEPVLEGDYYIIQKIDAFLNVYETDELNNTIVYGPYYINNIPEIFPDVTYDKQFGRNTILGSSNIPGLPIPWLTPAYDSGFDPNPDRHDFKINIPDGYGMITQMWEDEEANEAYGIPNESQPIYEMYVGEEYVPDPLNYDFRFDNPMQSSQNVVVPVDEARTDYIKSRAPYIPPHFDPEVVPVSNYFLRAELKQFSVFSLYPEKIGNAHNVTMRITGFDLEDPEGLDVALIQGNDTVFAFETYPQNASELIAYIDMRESPAGNYNLLVRKQSTGVTTVWEQPVEVIEDDGALLNTKVQAPEDTRIGLDFPVSVSYENEGYSNIYDMFVIVAVFLDDSTSNGLQVDYLGNTYTGYSGNGFISTEENPASLVEIGLFEDAVYYGAYVPIVHARTEETFHFKVSGDQAGIITTQATLGLIYRSPYTFTGRVADAGTSNYGLMLDRAVASSDEILAELAKASPNCDKVLNANNMTERLAEQTYNVAKKARGATGWYEDAKKSVTTFFGTNAGINKRYKAYKDMVSKKGELDLTANKDTPFFTELNDVFKCMEPGDVTKTPTDDACYEIVTWTDPATFTNYKVKMNMRGTNLACPDPDNPDKKHKPKDKKETDNTKSKDPNEITGPQGIGPARLVDGKEAFEYTIYFENVPESTAPAARVRIDNPIDTNLRLSSLRLVSFGFADTSFQFNNSPFVQQTINLGSEFDNQQLRILGGANPQMGKAFFEFTTINPETQGIVTGANDGFLWPNDSTGRGQGFITYLITPVADLNPGTQIKNKAAIIFDDNEIIETNTWSNTISGGELASKVLELPEFSASLFDLAWVNQTPEFGPPVESFDIYFRDVDQEGKWKKWLGSTKAMSKPFRGIPGHTYEFYSQAQSEDQIESIDGTWDARTTITNFTGVLDEDNPILFPNPASDQTQMGYQSSGKRISMQIKIANVQGMEVHAQRFTTPGAGVQFLTIPLRNLSAGLYVITLYEEGSKKGTAKLVVSGYPKN